MSADNEDLQRVAALLRDADEAAVTGDASAAADALARAGAMLDELGMTRAVFDEETSTWRFGHSQAGPAGATSVHYDGGGEFTVDLAEPSRVLTVTVPTEDAAAARAMVDQLIGPRAAELVTDGAASSALVPLERSGTPALRALSRLAVLDRAREQHEEQVGVWPLWAAEAAVLSSRAAAAVPSLRARAHAEATTSVRAVAKIAASELPDGARARLAELLPELADLVATEPGHALLVEAQQRLRNAAGEKGGGRLARVWNWVRPVREWVPGPVRPRWADIPLAAGRDGEPRPARFAVDASFEQYGLSSRVDAFLDYYVDTGEVSFRCEATSAAAERVDDLWLRAFTNAEYRLLDCEPLELDASGSVAAAVAELQVPAGMKVGELGFEVTATPADPIEGSRLWHISQAYQAGGRATDAQRVGDYKAEADLWRECAEHWTHGGDDEHAGRALLAAERATIRSVATPDESGEAQPPFFGELIDPD